MLTDDKVSVEVTDSTLDLGAIFAVLAEVCESSAKTQDGLVLFVPTDLGTRYDGEAFPGGTREVYHYLRERLIGQATVEAAVRDEDYVEFEFLSVDVILPVLYVASNVLLPIAINLLSDWVSRRLQALGKPDTDNKVKSEVHFNQNGMLKQINYEGPASTFETVMLEALRNENVPRSADEDEDDACDD